MPLFREFEGIVLRDYRCGLLRCILFRCYQIGVADGIIWQLVRAGREVAWADEGS